jgi:hypothetical protein
MRSILIISMVLLYGMSYSQNKKVQIETLMDSIVPRTINSYKDVDNNIGYKIAINNFYTNDLYAIKLTRFEFDSIANMDTEDSKMINFANSKGIYIDRGLIPIFVEKDKMIMVTYKFDFGTILTLETIQKELGEEIMLHYKSKIK